MLLILRILMILMTFWKGSLDDAYLYDFDFNNIDLTQYDYQNAIISEDVLKKHKLLDSSFYKKHTNKNIPYELNFKSESVENIDDKYSLISQAFNYNDIFVYYISDIHLDFKIQKEFSRPTSKPILKDYIRKIVSEIINSFYLDDYFYKILICGDTSYDF